MSDPTTTDDILFKIYDASPELHQIGRNEFVNRIGGYTEHEQNKHHIQFYLLPIENITLVLSNIEDAILGQHLEVPVAAMSLLRANFLPKGSELPGQTPVTIPLLRQYLCDDYPSIAEKAKLVKEKLDGAMLGTLRDIRSAGEKTWAGVTPPTIGEALGKIFTQQAAPGSSGSGGAAVTAPQNPPANDPSNNNNRTIVTAVPMTKEFKEFWNEWSNTQQNLLTATFTLPNNVFVFGEQRFGSTFYIRKCYSCLFSEIAACTAAGNNRIAIIGNPGIGKSWFLLYMLHSALKANTPIVYHCGGNYNMLLVHNNGVLQRLPMATELSTIAELDNPNTWYLVDTMQPNICKAKTVLVSSPHPNNYKQFMKDGATARYMPPWTHKEIESCRKACYPALTEALVKELFGKWGGLARFVLERSTDISQQNLLEQAIDACNLDDISHYVGESNTPDNASHKIMHICVETTGPQKYIRTKMLFASPYVADKIARKLITANRASMLAFISSSSSVSSITSTLRGHLFEAYAHTLLMNGGSFRVRNLHDGSNTTLTLPASIHKIIYQYSDVSTLVLNDYGQPFKKNFGAVDSIYCGATSSLFQMTVGEQHGIKVHCIDTVLNGLPVQAEYALYFVIPEEIFSIFATQTFKTKNAAAFVGPLPTRVKLVKQYALEVKLSP